MFEQNYPETEMNRVQDPTIACLFLSHILVLQESHNNKLHFFDTAFFVYFSG